MSAAFDLEAIRRDFPALDQQVHGRDLVYMDNAATTQKPRAVIDAVRNFYERDCSNVHRGVHALSQRATVAYESSRTTIRKHIGAHDSREIVFTRSTTEAINLVAASFLRPRLQPGDEILISEMEHHSNIVPWQLLRESTGAVLKMIPITDEGEIDLEAYERMLGPKTRLVGIVHVSNALGTVNPVKEMIAMAHEKGIPVLVDGAQAISHMDVDVVDLDCDFYAFSAHKVYGPSGIGALYGKRKHLLEMPPFQGGGDMILSVRFEETIFNEPPHRFEAGTPNIEGALGMATALEYIDDIGLDVIREHEEQLMKEASLRLPEVPGLRLIGQARQRAGAISFVLDGIHPHDVGTILDQEGIAVRAGHHCAQPVMQRYGLSATVRASFGIYNRKEDIDALIRGLESVREVFA